MYSHGNDSQLVATFKGELSSLTAPPFILSSTSLVEYSAYWAGQPALFVQPAKEADSEKRALQVLKWFLSTLHQQYCSRSEKFGSERKPLNPFLGELFIGKWKNGDSDVGDTSLISEQVSHHPPATAFAIRNENHGVQIGHALYTLTPPGSNEKEIYLITLPRLRIKSLLYGTPFVELERKSMIASSSGYIAEIDYSGKGWLSSKKNSFTASLYEASGGKKKPLYLVDGQWSDSFSISNLRTKEVVDKYVVRDSKTTPLTLAPIEKQDLYESRRAWSNVAAGIRQGDMDAVSRAKWCIESAQRELRRVEKAEGREWERRFFYRVDEKDEGPEFQYLSRVLDLSSTLDSEKSGGVWRFDAERAAGARPPYHKTGGKGLGISDAETSNLQNLATGHTLNFD
ncbi:hypothetical protein N7485_000435 [Penicillium canescens]|nr:hypothetical protein N7485_000435 [Penicillium canescens]